MGLKKNLLYNSLLSFSQVAFPLISIPYLSRILRPEGLGQVSFIDSLSYYFVVIAEFGIVTYGIKQVSRLRNDREALGRLVSDLLSLHILVSLVSMAIYILTVFLLYRHIGDLRFVLFSLSFLAVNSFACEWYFLGREEFRFVSLRSFATRTLGLISIFLLVNDSGDSIIYYAIIICSAMANQAWNAWRLFREIPVSFRAVRWKPHLPHLRVTYLISLVYSIVLMLDNVLLQLVSVSAAVAFYAFAAKLVRLSGGLVTDALLVFYPRTISLAHRNEQEQLQVTVMQVSQLILLLTIPMGAGIFLLADQFTLVYFGEAFAPLAHNLKILSLYPLVKAYSLFLNKQILMTYDKEKLILRGLALGAFVFLVLAFPLCYYFADKGMSFAIMGSELTVLLYNMQAVQRLGTHLRVLEQRTALEALAGSLLFVPIVWAGQWIESGLLAIMAEVLACLAVYALFLFFIARNRIALHIAHSFFPTLSLFKTSNRETRNR
ncbi:MAG TPA: oligosaccharide flippase family protein [Flavisolibacter sp.]|nr:oligosaccharide flippase family protein [Flavisolibacter sp.]